jgi:hypothetical protein
MVVKAQSTGFTYQGKLTDGANAANGSYDLQISLFDNLAGGTQIGSTLTRAGTNVAGGIFTVQLDFGVNAFPGANRFLEIGVRPVSSGGFTILSPRQQISSTPYAIRTLNATAADSLSNACVACVQDAQINSLSGSKVSGTVPLGSVPAGSGNYIQNTTTPQSAHFNVSGNGTIGGNLITNNNVGIGATNPFARLQVASAGNSATSYTARFQSSPSVAGAGGILFDQNSIYGWKIHTENTGFTDGILSFNYVNVSNGSAQAPNTLVLHGNGNVGIGTMSPSAPLHLVGVGSNSELRLEAPGGGITLIRYLNGTRHWATSVTTTGDFRIDDASNLFQKFVINAAGNVGIGTTSPDQMLSVNGNASKSSGGTSWAVFSDERLKNIKGPFNPGLKVLLQLQPIRYEYKADNALGLPGGTAEVGFSAQAVQQVLPEAVSRNQQGYLQLQSDPILWTMLNAVKEQQKQIERLTARVRELEKNRRRRAAVR